MLSLVLIFFGQRHASRWHSFLKSTSTLVLSSCASAFAVERTLLGCLLPPRGGRKPCEQNLAVKPILDQPTQLGYRTKDMVIVHWCWDEHQCYLHSETADWQSYVFLFCNICNPMDYIVHGILQARILEWRAISFSRGSSQPRDWTQVSCITGGFFTSWATREAQEYWVDSLSLLQQTSLIQELNQGLLHCRRILYQLSCQGSPICSWRSL